MKLQTRRYMTPLLLLILFALTACSAFQDPLVSIGLEDIETETVAEQIHTVEPELSSQDQMFPTGYSENTETIIATSDLENALIRLYQQANPSVVFIIGSSNSSGSGFVYSAEGHIVTNNHVVATGRNYEILFSNGERLRGELVGSDPDSDLAVLKVDSLPEGVSPLAVAQVDSLQVGQFVAAIGNPFGEQGSMSLGIVSGLGRSLPSQRGLTTQSTYSLPEVIQTDAPINPGNSGGPLLNLAGQVVGINAAIASTTGVGSGVGFAIPAKAIRLVIPSLIENGRYVYPYLGASFDNEVSLSEQSTYGLSQIQGAYIVGITPDGPAEQAGLVAANPTGRGGDLIVQIDGTPIQNFSDLNSYLVFNTSVGQTITLTILRGEDLLELPLTLGIRP